MASSRASSLASLLVEHQNLRETHTRAAPSPQRRATGGGARSWRGLDSDALELCRLNGALAGGGAGAAGLDGAPAVGGEQRGKQRGKGASAGGEVEIASARPRQICLARGMDSDQDCKRR
jgi:hypothetical protein